MAVTFVACSGGHPPRPTRRDGGRPLDSGAPPPDGSSYVDAARVDASFEHDGPPMLPPADQTVTLPYLGAAAEVTLGFSSRAEMGSIDVFFSIDTTGSFGGEIDALQAGLERDLVPTLMSRSSDIAFGVGRFEDFPISPFGSARDRPFTLLTGLTTDIDLVNSAVMDLDMPIGNGGDGPEAGAEALWQIATGEGSADGTTRYVEPYNHLVAPGGGSEGGVGFRHDSIRFVIHVTDAPTHTPADYTTSGVLPRTHSLSEAAEAMRAIDAHVLGIASGTQARGELEQVATMTGATVPAEGPSCATGIGGAATHVPVDGRCPLVYDIAPDGSGLTTAMADAISTFLDSVAFSEVYTIATDDRLGFVQSIEAASATPAELLRGRADRHPEGDGVFDTFTEVRSGADVQFVATLRNTTVPPADYEQSFRITLEVRGDERLLSRRTIRVTVPRGRLQHVDGGPRDAGRPDEHDSGVPTADAGTSPAPDAGGDPLDAGAT